VHALTKYIGGHGNSIGGIIVDSGKFPWAEHKARFKRLNEPDVSYHGVVYTEALGAAAYIGRARVVPLRNMGAALSPFNAFLILQGIETLALRMDRICDNTLKVASSCKKHPRWLGQLRRPARPPRHALVQKYMGGKASGILTFGVKGGNDRGRAALPGRAAADHPPGQHRRRQVAGLPPGLDHAPPAQSPKELAKAGVSKTWCACRSASSTSTT
jgi:O-acetylhomoserine (thiol)-lyase